MVRAACALGVAGSKVPPIEIVRRMVAISSLLGEDLGWEAAWRAGLSSAHFEVHFGATLETVPPGEGNLLLKL